MDYAGLNDILKGLIALQQQAHQTSKDFGYWDKDRNPAEVLANIHREVSDSLSALYDPAGSRSQKIPGFTNVEEHLADAIIRIMDFSGGAAMRVGAAVAAKMKYNDKLATVTKAKLNDL